MSPNWQLRCICPWQIILIRAQFGSQDIFSLWCTRAKWFMKKTNDVPERPVSKPCRECPVKGHTTIPSLAFCHPVHESTSCSPVNFCNLLSWNPTLVQRNRVMLQDPSSLHQHSFNSFSLGGRAGESLSLSPLKNHISIEMCGSDITSQVVPNLLYRLAINQY